MIVLCNSDETICSFLILYDLNILKSYDKRYIVLSLHLLGLKYKKKKKEKIVCLTIYFRDYFLFYFLFCLLSNGILLFVLFLLVRTLVKIWAAERIVSAVLPVIKSVPFFSTSKCHRHSVSHLRNLAVWCVYKFQSNNWASG